MREPPNRPRIRRALAIALILGLGAMAGPAPAEERVFAIGTVTVDETAGDAREARRVAVAAAQREAWLRLVDRMTTGDASSVPEPEAGTLETFVQGLEFADEKIAAGRYRAEITVRFRADAVLGWLDEAGAPHALAPIPVMLVLPILQTPDANLLWAEDNPWLAAWRRRPAHGFAVEIVAPAGDLDDLLAIDAGSALAGDWTKMRALAGRHAADGVLVALARRAGGRVEQTLTWYDGPEGETVPLHTPRGPEPRTDVIDDAPFLDKVGDALEIGDAAAGDDADYLAAVDIARRSVSDRWTAAALAPEGREAVMVVDIPVRGLADWVDIRGRLERPAAIDRFLPLIVSVDRVRVLLRYVGAVEDLRAGLRSAGLDLTARGGDWIVLPP